MGGSSHMRVISNCSWFKVVVKGGVDGLNGGSPASATGVHYGSVTENSRRKPRPSGRVGCQIF